VVAKPILTANSKKRPLLISFSGMDGSGKSTNIASLVAALEAAGNRVKVVTFWDNVVVFPRFRSNVTAAVFQGETGIGSPEKPVQRRDKNVRPWYATLGRSVLYLFDAFNLRRVVRHAYDATPDVVVFDRYLFDQLTTLPLEHGVARAYAKFLYSLVPHPDLSYLLDADPEAAFQRKPEYPLDFLRQYRRSYSQVNDLLGSMTVIPPLPLEEARRRVALEAAKAGIQLQFSTQPARANA
jgi:thymidylate kinase